MELEAGKESTKKPDKVKIKNIKSVSKKGDIDCEKLINEVQNFPCIWDKGCAFYKIPAKKYFAWKKISESLNVPESEVKGKWKNLSDTFRRYFNAAWHGHSGDVLDNEKLEAVQWRYFQSMLFMKDSFQRRKTSSNYVDEEMDNEGVDREKLFEASEVLADENCDVHQVHESEKSPQTSLHNGNLIETPVREQLTKRKRKSDPNDILARLTTNS